MSRAIAVFTVFGLLLGTLVFVGCTGSTSSGNAATPTPTLTPPAPPSQNTYAAPTGNSDSMAADAQAADSGAVAQQPDQSSAVNANDAELNA